MKKSKKSQRTGHSLESLPLEKLQKLWSEAWGLQPHSKISRMMLIKSLEYKFREHESGGLSIELQECLKKMMTSYKRNPRCFDENIHGLKPGTQLVKLWKEKRHSVLVVPDGFEYQNKIHTSLSAVSKAITGINYNGWIFFGFKKRTQSEKYERDD